MIKTDRVNVTTHIMTLEHAELTKILALELAARKNVTIPHHATTEVYYQPTKKVLTLKVVIDHELSPRSAEAIS